ncbi:uncharacterized protein At2g39795, mitochondrial-like [Nicotiana tabacum]|uniref:Uncharacterized protein At2g39795, mitochondrial-like n=1 Tax=Nicotiana tabacum TaxID=4097 RepID=A0A1S4CS89_TOBAC|nr:PREDICTED: uncharacterized protein At2g39795, mitochondrial-like [Nicotiana tabacum]
MALSNVIRRTASQVVPLAVRSIRRSQSYHHSALFSAVVDRRAVHRNLFRSSVPSTLHLYSTQKRSSSDESLLKVIQSEIQFAEESDEQNKADEVPEGFPFTLEDHPGQQTISLTKEYQGETINVEVHMPDLVTDDDDEDGNDNDDTERPAQSQLPLVVRVSKRNGPCLEFGCTTYPDEVVIDHLAIKDPDAADEQIAYEGPEFSYLDENIQKAFHKYLEIRGIKPRTTNFLHEYMINKDSREYLMWIKNVKKFIEA